MNDMYNLELTATEFVCVMAGIALYHKEVAKSLYETLEGLRNESTSISVEEFDEQHKAIMSLYDKLAAITEQMKE